MKHLKIEWKHYAKENKTCDRCFSTGRNVQQAIHKLKHNCENLDISFKEHQLLESQLEESNSILLNGIPFEKAFSNVVVSQNSCDSCSALIKKQSSCRSIKCGSDQYDDVPTNMIYQAACEVLQCCKIV